MNGKIEITMDDVGLKINMNVHKISKMQMFGVFSTLADGFKLNSLDRLLLGAWLATSDPEGSGATKVELNPELLDLIKKMKEKQNETDAL